MTQKLNTKYVFEIVDGPSVADLKTAVDSAYGDSAAPVTFKFRPAGLDQDGMLANIVGAATETVTVLPVGLTRNSATSNTYMVYGYITADAAGNLNMPCTVRETGSPATETTGLPVKTFLRLAYDASAHAGCIVNYDNGVNDVKLTVPKVEHPDWTPSQPPLPRSMRVASV